MSDMALAGRGGTGSAGRSRSSPSGETPIQFECYCGLGPACPLFNQMTPDERVLCSQDKRQTGQYYWKNGLGWAHALARGNPNG